MTRICVVLLVLFGVPSAFTEDFLPDRHFRFAEQQHHAWSSRHPFENTVRTKILGSLARPDRDDVLSRIVPWCLIGGERWFDLRGITVGRNELARDADLSRICWDEAEFIETDLSGTELNGALLRGASFIRADLRGANVDNAFLDCCDFNGCNLSGTNFRLARFSPHSAFRQSTVDGARFDNCSNLNGVLFDSVTLRSAVFVNVRAVGIQFLNSDLSRCDFRNAILINAEWFGSFINECDFTDADLSAGRLHAAKLTTPLRFVRTRLVGAFLGDLDIGKMDISYVEWGKNDLTGEEIKADMIGGERTGRDDGPRGANHKELLERRRLYARAETVYNALAEKYRQSRQTDEYLSAHYRSMETRRKLASLDLRARNTVGYVWLNISSVVDEHGTSARRLLISFVCVVIACAGFYFLGWTVFHRDWAVWCRISVDGRVVTAQDGRPVISGRAAPRQVYGDAKGAHKLAVCCQFAREAVWFSTEAFFLFSDKPLGMLGILNTFWGREERLVPKGFARVVVGLQSIVGLIFVALAARMIVLMAGWS